jgi:hypothetical protein
MTLVATYNGLDDGKSKKRVLQARIDTFMLINNRK